MHACAYFQLAILAQGKKPYFKLWVRAKDQLPPLMYVGTEEQTLNYDPETYQGRWESNLSGMGMYCMTLVRNYSI